jgi:hypothetical protein
VMASVRPARHRGRPDARSAPRILAASG